MLPTKYLIIIFLKLLLINITMTGHVKPKVLVFDLDYTLWPFWVDTHVTPPFRKNSNDIIKDAYGNTITYYPEAPEVLENLHKQGYILAVASRTGEIQGARDLIKLFNWKKFISHEEIYPGSKTTHLTNIKATFGVKFSEIIFFDDEGRNIRDVAELGVLSIHVRNGITKKVVDDALKQYADNHR